MHVRTSAEVVIPGVPPERVFARATDPAAAAEFFTGKGLVPGIRRIVPHDAGPTRVGTRRRVELADGSTIEEEVLEFDVPRRHRYRVSGYHGLLAALVREAEGDWEFSAAEGGTRIVWRYAYHGRGAWAALPLAVIVKGPFRSALGAALQKLRSQLAAAR